MQIIRLCLRHPGSDTLSRTQASVLTTLHGNLMHPQVSEFGGFPSTSVWSTSPKCVESIYLDLSPPFHFIQPLLQLNTVTDSKLVSLPLFVFSLLHSFIFLAFTDTYYVF